MESFEWFIWAALVFFGLVLASAGVYNLVALPAYTLDWNISEYAYYLRHHAGGGLALAMGLSFILVACGWRTSDVFENAELFLESIGGIFVWALVCKALLYWGFASIGAAVIAIFLVLQVLWSLVNFVRIILAKLQTGQEAIEQATKRKNNPSGDSYVLTLSDGEAIDLGGYSRQELYRVIRELNNQLDEACVRLAAQGEDSDGVSSMAEKSRVLGHRLVGGHSGEFWENQ